MGRGRPNREGRLGIRYVIIGHRFGHQSGLDESSREKSAAIPRRIVARFYLVFLKIDVRRLRFMQILETCSNNKDACRNQKM